MLLLPLLMSKNNKNEGIIIRVAGPIVDVRFADNPPPIHEALEIDLEKNTKLVLEVAFAMGDNEVKTLAMGSTDGLQRGMKVKRTNSPIKVPVGFPTLGRIFNVLGQTVDGKPFDSNHKNLSYNPFIMPHLY